MEKDRNKDMLRKLFAAMPDEQLPPHLNDVIMLHIGRIAARREMRRKIWSAVGYALGIIAMIAACIVALYFSGISFETLDISKYKWTSMPTFYKPDFTIFKSPFFAGSMCVGMLGLLLLIIDDVIRRHSKKLKNE